MSLALSSDRISENGGESRVTASLSGTSSAAVEVTVSATPVGPAVPGDYTLSTNRKLTIAAGATTSTGTVTITANDNNVDAPHKEVTVSGGASGGNGVADPESKTLTIEDNESLPTVSLALSSDRISEDGGESRVTATLSGTSSAAVEVTVSATPVGPAVPGDFTLSTNRKLTIAAGATTSTGTVTITAKDNNVNAPHKTVTVSGNASGGNGVADPESKTLTITDDESLPTVSLELSAASISENGGESRVTASLSGTSSAAVEVTVSATPVSPAVPGDFTLSTNRKLTIAAGATTSTGTVTITANDNNVNAPHKTVTVSGDASGGNGVTDPESKTLTITDDESLPTVSLALSAASISENGGESTVTATLSGTSSAAVEVTVSATPVGPAVPGDFTLSTNRKLTIAAGATTSTGTVTITANDNNVVGGTKEVTVSGSATGGNRVAPPESSTLMITDDDVATLGFEPTMVSVAEGSKAAFTVKLTRAASSEVTFNWQTADDEATAGSDYTAQAATSLTIAAGGTSATLEVQTTADDLVEGDETFEARISANSLPTGVSLGTAKATATITDDDERGLALSETGVTVTEASGAGRTASYTVALNSQPTAQVTAQVTVAVSSRDAAVATVNLAELTFTTGDWATGQTVTVSAVDDAIDNTPERTTTIDHTASGGDYGSVTGTVAVTVSDDEGGAAFSIADASVIEGNTDTADLTFTVTLSPAAGVQTTVQWATSDGTATAGADYTAGSGTLTFAAGVSERTVTVQVTDDEIDEADETLIVTLSNAGGAVLGRAMATGTIIDDDDAPDGITLSVNPETVAENVSSAPAVTVTAAVNGATRYTDAKTVTVAVGASTDSATEGTDYAEVADLSVTIRAGAASGTETFTLSPTDDNVHEGDETISVTGASGTLTVTGTTIAITDDDAAPPPPPPPPPPTVELTLSPATIGENGGVSTVTASLSRRSSAKVEVTVSAAAVSPAVDGDFTLSANTKLTIAAGETASTGTVTITANDNPVDAPNKMVTVSGAASGGNGVADPDDQTLTITDDDAAPSGVTMSVDPATVTENGGAKTVTVKASVNGSTRYADAKTVAVTVGAAGDSATEGTDYATVGALTISIAAGADSGTAAFTLDTTDDDRYEGDEEVSVSGASDVTVTDTSLTIIDDDEMPSFWIADVAVEEGKTADFVVTRIGATGHSVSVTWTTAEHTDGRYPASTSDYGPVTIPETLRFGTGETEKIARVRTHQDLMDEPFETFLVRLSGASSNAVIADDGAVAIGTIVNDDPPPTISIADAAPVVEGAAAHFPVRLSMVSGRAITVDWVTAAGTATEDADYVAGAGTLTIAEGTTAATIEVVTIDDTEIEGAAPETFTVTLTNPVNVTIGDGMATGRIEDDDRPAAIARIRRVNGTVLARLGSVLLRSRIDQLAGCVDHAVSGDGGEGLSGLTEAAGLLANRAEAVNRGEVSVQEALAGARLATKMAVNDGPAERTDFGDLTFCAGGDWHRLASMDGGPVPWDGSLLEAHVGGNVRLGGSVLAGLDVFHHAGSADWRDGAGAEAFAGDWRMHLNAVHPYAVWFTPEGVRLVAMMGLGLGNVRVVEPARIDESADLTLMSLAASGVMPLATRGAETAVQFRADAWHGEFNVAGNGSLIEEQLVLAQGLRVLAEGELRFDLGGGASLAPSPRIGLHYDEATGGLGLEVGSGLRWRFPQLRLSAELAGRLLVALTGVQEWGVSGAARLAPADGLGPSLRVAPSWGATADGTRALWERGPAPAVRAAPAPLSLEVESGWGLSISDGGGVLTPFAGLALSGEDTRSMHLGGRLAVDAFSLEVAGTRRESGSAAPDYVMTLQAVGSW